MTCKCDCQADAETLGNLVTLPDLQVTVDAIEKAYAALKLILRNIEEGKGAL